jgi:hypothetical protein
MKRPPGLLTAILSAATFIVVLWTIGGALTITVAGVTITIPGFLVVGAVIYAVLASGSMVFIGRRFVTVSENTITRACERSRPLTSLSPLSFCKRSVRFPAAITVADYMITVASSFIAREVGPERALVAFDGAAAVLPRRRSAKE